MPASSQELFDWHARPGAFERLTPPWQGAEIISEDPGFSEGKEVKLKVSTPIGKRPWLARHTSCIAGEEFTDEQIAGPFKSWKHRHQFRYIDDQKSELIDSIDFEMPVGSLGETIARRQLEKMFDYRHWVTARDLRLKASLPNFKPLKIAITGGNGFLGAQLSALLKTQGHDVSVVTRSKRRDSDIRWDPAKGEIELPRLEGLDAVINLAGENLTSGRWSDERKKRIYNSRIDGTKLLVDAFLQLDEPPEVFLSGSASGYYGHHPEKEFDETSSAGEGFLAEVCQDWEAAALRAESARTRVCLLRTGIVIDPRGGALQKMLPAFRFGLGGPLGNGEQWFPWVSIEDWIGGVAWLLFAQKAKGPVNLVSPQALQQKEFAKELGSALSRPAVFPAPKVALRLALGEMADEALLASAKVQPKALERLDYDFATPRLSDLLSRIL